MSRSSLLLGITLAVVLYVVLPLIIFPVFYAFLSPAFGCSPIGDESNLFSLQVFQAPQIEATCPQNSNIYWGLLVYLLIITILLGILLFKVNVGLPVVLIGAIIPSFYFVVYGLGYVQGYDSTSINIISLFIILIGVCISWRKS